jgi:hypothetical protein
MKPTKINPKNDIKIILFMINYNDIRHRLRIMFIIIQFNSFQIYLRAVSTARGTITGTARRGKYKNIEHKTYNRKHKRILK